MTDDMDGKRTVKITVTDIMDFDVYHCCPSRGCYDKKLVKKKSVQHVEEKRSMKKNPAEFNYCTALVKKQIKRSQSGDQLCPRS